MGILDVLKRLRRGGRAVALCPRCLSPRIRRSRGFSGWLLPTTYECPDCGYRGPLVLEVDAEEAKETRPEDRGG